MQEIRQALKDACKNLFGVEIEPELSRPDEQFGDFATNVALQLGKQQGKNPREVAESLKNKLDELGYYKSVTVAGPGFLNINLKDNDIANMAIGATNLAKPLAGQQVLVEFGDPNPFKELHIGHLYSLIAGNAIATLLENAGADVKRLSYHGDVGLHVAKAVWGMRKDSGDTSAAYAAGAKAYEEDEQAKAEIDDINEHIYKHDDAEINKLYDAGRAQSLDSFDQTYQTLGIKYDKHYFESESTPIGVKFVQDNPNVFKQSQGATIFDGEKVGLHTRVFITSKGLPTYETKDLGLAELKNQDFPQAARSIIITANEQAEYFKVMLAALAEIDKPLADKTTHLSHGFVNLTTGKMSSRTGDVYAAGTLLGEVKKATHEQYPDSQVHKEVGLGAIKYAFTKHRIGPDMLFDIKESIGLEGNSGPYIQYAHARAQSILAKAGEPPGELKDLDPSERSLARKISEYPEVVSKATAELMPHYVCTYLYELAQSFNGFYEKSRVIGDPRQNTRLKLVETYAAVLKNGLKLLNIAAPDQM